MVGSYTSTCPQVWWRYLFQLAAKHQFISLTAVSAILFALLPLSPKAQIIELDSTLSEYVQEGLKANPNLVALSSMVEAAEKRISQVGSWPDPTLGFSIANLPADNFAFDQEPMTAAWIQLGQRIPLGGKTSILSKIAESHTDALRYEEKAQQLSLAAEIINTWYDWAFQLESIKVVEAEIGLMDDFIAVARRKYETGQGLQQDVLRASTERTRLEDRLAGVQQTALTSSRRLAVLLGREADDLPEPPAGLIETFPRISQKEILGQMLEQNPDLKRMSAELTAANRRVSFAHRNWWPDLNLGIGYGFRQDSPEGMERPDFFSASVGITVPIYGSRKQGPAVQEARANSRQVAYQQRALELELRFQYERLLDEDGRLDKQINLYLQGIEPQAQATLAAATAEYAVGKVDFEALLMAERALYEARLERFSRVRDRLKVRAALAALVGDSYLTTSSESEEKK